MKCFILMYDRDSEDSCVQRGLVSEKVRFVFFNIFVSRCSEVEVCLYIYFVLFVCVNRFFFFIDKNNIK